jgi:hypothetical protein
MTMTASLPSVSKYRISKSGMVFLYRLTTPSMHLRTHGLWQPPELSLAKAGQNVIEMRRD